MGKCTIEIKEIMRDTDGRAYQTTITANGINQFDLMGELARSVLALAEKGDKNKLMIAFLTQLGINYKVF